jgi:hypothetical protein
MIQKLFDYDMERGVVDEVIEQDIDGKVQEPEVQKKVEALRVVFHNTNEQDLPYVFIGLNGRAFYIPKDREVMIPKELLQVINDSIEIRMKPFRKRDGSMGYSEQMIQRFPYTVKG